MTDKPLRVVLGAGPQPIDPYHLKFIDATWLLTDLHPNADSIMKVDAAALPWENESVEAIYASHLLEHFPRHRIEAILGEWARVLKPRASLVISVPDAEWAAEQLLKGKESLALDVFYNQDLDGLRDCHRMCFTAETLVNYLSKHFSITDIGCEFESHHVQSITAKAFRK